MPESETQTPEGGAAPATPVPAATPSGGGVPAGFVPQEVADQAEARRRATQSALDQEKAKSADLSGRLSKVEEMMGRFDPNAVADQFTARFNQQQALASARSEAKETYKLARAEVLDAKYETPEELLQAVKSSHEAEETYRTSIREQAEKDVLASLKERHGIDLPTPAPQTPPTEGEGGGKPPLTQADLAAMPMKDYLALDQSVIDSVTA